MIDKTVPTILRFGYRCGETVVIKPSQYVCLILGSCNTKTADAIVNAKLDRSLDTALCSYCLNTPVKRVFFCYKIPL